MRQCRRSVSAAPDDVASTADAGNLVVLSRVRGKAGGGFLGRPSWWDCCGPCLAAAMIIPRVFVAIGAEVAAVKTDEMIAQLAQVSWDQER